MTDPKSLLTPSVKKAPGTVTVPRALYIFSRWLPRALPSFRRVWLREGMAAPLEWIGMLTYLLKAISDGYLWAMRHMRRSWKLQDNKDADDVEIESWRFIPLISRIGPLTSHSPWGQEKNCKQECCCSMISASRCLDLDWNESRAAGAVLPLSKPMFIRSSRSAKTPSLLCPLPLPEQ